MENIQNNGGAILLVMFITGLLSVSASTMDSSLHSVGSIIASKFKNEKIQRTVAKISIVSFCIIAYALVQLKIDLWILLVTFGAVRLSLVVPTGVLGDAGVAQGGRLLLELATQRRRRGQERNQAGHRGAQDARWRRRDGEFELEIHK